MKTYLSRWIPFFRPARAKSGRIYWVIEESEVFQCCTAIKFYNQQNELLHCEEMPGIDFKSLDEALIRQLNQKAQEVLVSI
ncbi:MAG: hypothetical protein MUE85_21845 [Microscillaceae bacterium]|jgi:hypothetical protein|nr:hypothetical protein [Microscillaceae bacterium]